MCNDQLDEPGALILSPPDESDRVKKWHVCELCYDTKLLPILADTPMMVEDGWDGC